MINNSKEEDYQTKKDRTTNDGKTNAKASSSVSAPWLRLKDPRIVRVSRAFGGKDRHSKVCTIRGLRDRRVRLSVPTAIQLYDLQDRLGLNQPSKVIDWLLNAAKHEIDELPPLPISPMSFGLNRQPILPHEVGTSEFNKGGFKMNNWEDKSGLTRPSSWSGDTQLRSKSKQVAEESAKRDELDEQESNEEDNSTTPQVQFSSTRLFRAAQSSSSATGLMNNPMPYSSFFQLEHTNYPFSQMGSFGFQNQADNLQDLNTVPLPSTLSLSSGSQVFLCPQGTPQLYLPSHVSADSADQIDPRQLNHFQMFPSSTQNLFPSSLDNNKAFPFPQQWKSA